MAADNKVSYPDWVKHLLSVDVSPAADFEGNAPSPRTAALENPKTIGLTTHKLTSCMDKLRGFSLHTAFRALDSDDDGYVSIKELRHAFTTFFEWLSPSDLSTALGMFAPSIESDKYSWLDCLWQFDTAFMLAHGEIEAMQQRRDHLTARIQNKDLMNPWEVIRDYVQRKDSGGKGSKAGSSLRALFSIIDRSGTGTLTKAGFRELLRDEVKLTQLTDEELDFVFEQVDTDGDDAITFREFEKEVTGQDKAKMINNMLMQMIRGIEANNLVLDDVIEMFDINRDGSLNRGEFKRLINRLDARVSEDELTLLMDELDTDGSGEIALHEFKWQMRAVRSNALIEEFKSHILMQGISLYDAFIEADDDQSGTLSYVEFETLLLRRYKMNITKGRLRTLYDLFDEDGSGAVSYAEFLRRLGLKAKSTGSHQVKFLPKGEGQAWVDAVLAAIKGALAQILRKDRGETAFRNYFLQYDPRETGTLNALQIRRALTALGFEADPKAFDANRFVDLLSDRGKGKARGVQGSQRGREVRIDALIPRLMAVHASEEDSLAVREKAEGGMGRLRTGLETQGLSLIKLLQDLDPKSTGKVLYHAFRIQASRLPLKLRDEDFENLRKLLNVDSRGFFAAHDLLQEMRATVRDKGKEEPNAAFQESNRKTERQEGLPAPLQTRSKKQHQVDSVTRDVSEFEKQHKKQVLALTEQLRNVDEEKRQLLQQVNDMKIKEVDLEDQLTSLRSAKKDKSSQGAGATKELRLEVQGTKELREKLFATETELEECHRRLNVDSRIAFEKEQHRNAKLKKDLDEALRNVADLEFDLRRAQAAKGDDFAFQDEMQMRVHVKCKKLSEELEKEKDTTDRLNDMLLHEQHSNMDLSFQKESSERSLKRLQNRCIELELLAGSKTSDISAGDSQRSRKESNLEAVIEGLERVLAKVQLENQRMIRELEATKKDEKPQRKEIDRLRKKIQELQEELGGRDRSVKMAGRELRKGSRSIASGQEANSALRKELEVKTERISELEGRLQRAMGSGAAQAGPPAEGGDAALLRELEELRVAREADLAALDEAQRVLREVETTEQRYLDVARENKRLKADLGALNNDAFWDDLESLKQRHIDSTKLLVECKYQFESLCESFPALSPPAELLGRLARFIQEAAPAA
eukprot:gnl/MRDRNA2_/MRDRNA2_72809_c0_seq2.p1 gnl/MRDRNA2_/MRDRNA2_72809_c0~~gnl/MRDRNA2_/MRDRNA2_72809_c0_seq2.p1  ORF type:complete len:1239 (+),score=336.78 gnl/MRDRNA2_/MRDRNA2_72809_c0_seq2:260-3718(+)